MAQRWVEAKMILGRKHGFARSGANRAMGGVWDDKMVGRIDSRVKGKPSDRVTVLHGSDVFDAKSGGIIVARKPQCERSRIQTAPVWKRPRGYVAR